jgi:hypothetical protein
LLERIAWARALLEKVPEVGPFYPETCIRRKIGNKKNNWTRTKTRSRNGFLDNPIIKIKSS